MATPYDDPAERASLLGRQGSFMAENPYLEGACNLQTTARNGHALKPTHPHSYHRGFAFRETPTARNVGLE